MDKELRAGLKAFGLALRAKRGFDRTLRNIQDETGIAPSTWARAEKGHEVSLAMFAKMVVWLNPPSLNIVFEYMGIFKVEKRESNPDVRTPGGRCFDHACHYCFNQECGLDRKSVYVDGICPGYVIPLINDKQGGPRLPGGHCLSKSCMYNANLKCGYGGCLYYDSGDGCRQYCKEVI